MAIKNLGRFDIIDEIGSGGMGVVYKGRDPKINRLVALKVVRPVMGVSKSADQEQAISRFHVEAQAAGQLSHPNIVTIYDVGEEVAPEGTLVYIAMEFVSGKGLDYHIANKTFITLEQKIQVIKAIAEGLDYAHKKGVVHRDVKPANVIITDEGIPKLTDFGLARLSDSSLTMSGTILGTPNYMSPEQVQGKKVDARSDFFSLTVVLYEIITNEKPFAAESITSVIYKVVHEDPVPPRRLNASLPHMVDAFIRKGLAKNPDSRFQSGADYLKGLNAILSGDGREIVSDSGQEFVQRAIFQNGEGRLYRSRGWAGDDRGACAHVFGRWKKTGANRANRRPAIPGCRQSSGTGTSATSVASSGDTSASSRPGKAGGPGRFADATTAPHRSGTKKGT